MTSWVAPSLFDTREATPWPFRAPNAKSDTLEPQAYRFVMLDPPWYFEPYSDETGAEKAPDYDLMTLEDIAALPVGDLLAADALVMLWCTAPMLDQQIALLPGWGLEFCTSGVWVKTTVKGKIAFGPGYVLRGAHEPFVIAKRGNPIIGSKSVRSVIMAAVREHSRKPDEAYQMAGELVPYGRRCDVFSRERRPGWDVWGNQVGFFDEVGNDKRRRRKRERERLGLDL